MMMEIWINSNEYVLFLFQVVLLLCDDHNPIIAPEIKPIFMVM